MKKTLIIALCCIGVILSACKKPLDYAENYVGSYLGKFTLAITSMNNQAQTGVSFPIDSIKMNIAKADSINTIIATVTIENEPYQAKGTVSESQIHFAPIPLNLEKPDFVIEGSIQLEGVKDKNELNINGGFSGKGMAIFMGLPNVFDEVSGTVSGKLDKQ